MSWGNQWPQVPPQQGMPSTPGMSYTTEQWTQMQQQNWQQWMQWQQQYQQWHQQYGAEYQKSMNALAAQSVLPNMAMPPPLPLESTKPPLPPDDTPQYTTAPPPPSNPIASYSTQPPLQNFNAPPPNLNQSWPSSNVPPPIDNSQFNKTPANQSLDTRTAKVPLLDKPPNSTWQGSAPTQTNNAQWKAPPPAQPQTSNSEELSEAEKKFDKQFAEWEAQFNKWKEQNVEHPDKQQYREYEKKWESWRNQLLDRREQMRRKRLGLPLLSLSTNTTKLPQQTFTQPPPNTNMSQACPVESVPNDKKPVGYGKPPPDRNNEPLLFQPPPNASAMEIDLPREPEGGSDFLKSSSTEGIPGLDLVKDGEAGDLPDEPPKTQKVPDLDALSKGINSILGDPKLLNMLSMVTQNQNINLNVTTDATSKIQDSAERNVNMQSLLQDQSNQSMEDSFGQRETVQNFDDQTRSSFTMQPPEEAIGGSNVNRPAANNFPNQADDKFKLNSFNDAPFRQSNPDRSDFNQNNFSSLLNTNFNQDKSEFDKGNLMNQQKPNFSRPPPFYEGSGWERNMNRPPPPIPKDRDQSAPFAGRPNVPVPNLNMKPNQTNSPAPEIMNFDRNFGPPPAKRGNFSLDNRPGLGNDKIGSGTLGTGSDRFPSVNDRFGLGDKFGAGDRFGGNRNASAGDKFGPGGNNFGSGGNNFGSGADKFGGGVNKLGPGGDRFPPAGDRFGPGGDRFGSSGDKFGPGINKFGGNRLGTNGGDKFGSGDLIGPPGGNRFSSGDRFGSEDRFGAGADKFGPGGNRFGSGGDRFGAGADKFGPGGNKFGPGGDRFGTSADKFGPGGNTFGPGGDRFGTGADKFGPGGDRFGAGAVKFGPVGEKFGATGDRFGPGGGDKFRSEIDKLAPSGNTPGPMSAKFGMDNRLGGPGGKFGSENERFGGEKVGLGDRPGPGGRFSADNEQKFGFGADKLGPGPSRFPSQDEKNGPPRFGNRPEGIGFNNDRFARNNENQERPNIDNLAGRPPQDRFGNLNRFGQVNPNSGSLNDKPDLRNNREGSRNFDRNNMDNRGESFNTRLGPGFNKGPLNSEPINKPFQESKSNFSAYGAQSEFTSSRNIDERNDNLDEDDDEDDIEAIHERFSQADREFENDWHSTPTNSLNIPPLMPRQNSSIIPRNNPPRIAANFDDRRDFNNRGFAQHQQDYENNDRFWNKNNKNDESVSNAPRDNFEEVNKKKEIEPPPLDDGIWKPETVIEYDHKSRKEDEMDVVIEPLHMFDYRHKPINRIPYSERPDWLTETVRMIPEFDPPPLRAYNPEIQRVNLLDRPEYRNELAYDRREDRNFDSRMVYRREEMKDREYKKYERDYERESYGDRNEFEEHRTEYDKSHSYERDDWNNKKSRISRDRDRKTEDYSFESEKKPHLDEPRNKNFDSRKPNVDIPSEKVSFKPNDYDVKEYAFYEMKEKELSAQPKIDFKPRHDARKANAPNVTLIEDLINAPGRFKRPARIAIILRGPPGSGKTYLAKLIKDKEVEHGGSAPRILSLDDYFMVENEKEVIEDGKKVMVKNMVYEFEQGMEQSYRLSMMRSFKKTVTDGYFSFIIVDNINDKVKYFGEMWSFAKQNGFEVYICEMDLDMQNCIKRNVHNRTESEIKKIIESWEKTPAHHPLVDATALLQSASIPEVEMEEINSPASDDDDPSKSDEAEDQLRSKWDNFDCSNDNLAKLDGVNKPLRSSGTMQEYLQLDEWEPIKHAKPGQKTVRWADLEARKQQEKMRAVGFVVGQTDWGRMMDPSMGASALTQTKYIDRVKK